VHLARGDGGAARNREAARQSRRRKKEHLELLGCAQSMPLADLPAALFAPVGGRAPWLEFMADVKRDE
jgi:hypothetical protein